MAELHHRRQSCRLCGGTDLTLVLALEPTPPANAFMPAEGLGEAQAVFPLDAFFCENCAHVQLLDVVDPEVLFGNYVYVSGTSPIFVQHFGTYAEAVLAIAKPAPGALVVDVGSNDGTLLRFFQQAGQRVLGIDPARDIAARATAGGIPTEVGFFDRDTALDIRGRMGPAAIVTANNVFAHIDDLAGVAEGIRSLLAPDGLFVFEVSYLRDVFEKTLFDTIYHEHLAYHAVKPLVPFFAAHGLELIEAVRVSSHGGSLRGIVQLKGGPRPVGASVAEAITAEEKLGLDRAETFKAFGRRIGELRDQLGGLLRGLKAEGKAIAGYGAPAKATTLMYHFGLGRDLVDFIIDDSPLKQNLYSPGLHVPVLPASALVERKPDYLLVLAWNFADAIIGKNAAYAQAGGKFIVPLPDIKIR